MHFVHRETVREHHQLVAKPVENVWEIHWER